MEDSPNLCWLNPNFLPHAILETFLPLRAGLSSFNVPLAANYPQHAVFKASWMKARVFINKMSFPAEGRCSRYSVSSNIHWANGFPWPLISFDSYIVPSRAAFPFLPRQGHKSASRKISAAVPRAARELISSTCTAGELAPAKCRGPGLCLDSGQILGHQEQLCSQCDGGKVERDFPRLKYRKYYSSEQAINILLQKARGKVSATVLQEGAVGDLMVKITRDKPAGYPQEHLQWTYLHFCGICPS